MKAVLHLDMELMPRTFDTPDEAITFVERKFQDPELKIKWRRDDNYPNNYTDYTRQQLLEEYNRTGEICLQLVGGEGEDIIIGEIANIITEEKENQDVAEAEAELTKVGQELADTYQTKISLGWQGYNQKTFKPKKARIKRKKK
jgi:hypothetical protein